MHEAISEMDGDATCPQLRHLISAYTAADAARGGDADKNLALMQLLDNNKWPIVSCYPYAYQLANWQTSLKFATVLVSAIKIDISIGEPAGWSLVPDVQVPGRGGSARLPTIGISSISNVL